MNSNDESLWEDELCVSDAGKLPDGDRDNSSNTTKGRVVYIYAGGLTEEL